MKIDKIEILSCKITTIVYEPTLTPEVSVHPSAISSSRKWLQDLDAVVDPTAIKQTILDTKLPTIYEVPYSKWRDEFEEAIIVTKTSALFDDVKMENQTAQLIVARGTWLKELNRCVPLLSFPEDDTFPEILTWIHKTFKDSEAAIAATAFLEVTSQRDW
ncbi:hypothetical protein CFO_g795 [Ceratocystis platani]|uniref:Uncharacterized protein n=1 Tax=Ceratocystis fimbriata f. sp. platani TaxID=88771 RepID=A0A0F8D251_CERFI|nr:hypothetical protein CFO_g795 [Ceratocystis platani]